MPQKYGRCIRLKASGKVNEESDRLGMMKGQHDGLMDRKKELEEKLAMISLPGAKCPLCQTELGHEKHEEVITDYRRRIAEMQESINGFRKDGTQAKARLAALRKEIEEIDAKASAGRDVRNRLAKAEQVVFTVEESNKRIPSIKAKLDEVLKSIEGGKYAPEESARLLNISSSIAALTYNPEEHNKIKEDIALLAMYESLAANLKNAENSLPGDEASLAAVRELILSRERSIQECTRSAEELRGMLIELPDVKAELALTDRELTQLRETDRELTGKIATLASTLSRIKVLKIEAGEKKKALDQAKKDKAAYTALVSAFGKKGVQALIIENAIPEIQEEANRLLARMTDNAMQVAIETIRDKKTGGTAETLDIKISDDMGTRSYELFSGGEAFRVNFALRIALSKLLARRAGASLQTLIIDEGFGTQDGKGREKLVEAISSIQDDFSLILVVTHIDELKDAFPTRIEITKDSAGSQIQVN
jgi:exonuclease SbcC